MPSRDRAELVRVGSGEAVAQRDVAVGRDAQQAEAGAARERLAHALVDFLERLLDVREAVMPVRRPTPRGTRSASSRNWPSISSKPSSEMAWPRVGEVVTGAKPTSRKPISSVRCR